MNVAYNVDCMEYMKSLPDKAFDLAVCDPPYRDQSENRPTKDMRKNGTMKNFGNKPNENFFKELFRVSKEQVIWGANNFYLPNYKGFLVWEKTMFQKISRCRWQRLHTYQKDLEQFQKFLNILRKELRMNHESTQPKNQWRCIDGFLAIMQNRETKSLTHTLALAAAA